MSTIKTYCPVQALKNFHLYKNKLKQEYQVEIQDLTELGIDILKKKYCYKNANEHTIEDCFARVALVGTEDYENAKRMYKYLTKGYFSAATPIMANIGFPENIEYDGIKIKSRGSPISCFLNESGSTTEEKIYTLTENCYISNKWGGIGTLLDGIASEDLMTYCKALESNNAAFGNKQRKSSVAVYLSISHAGIENFIEMRRPVGGDHRLKCLHVHHGIIIPDAFYECMQKGKMWPLYENDGTFVKEVDPISLFVNLTKMRIETGEPYILNIDRVRDSTPNFHKEKNRYPKTSNLCTEITLYTDKERTAVCCLGSLNLASYDEWKDDPQIIEDCMTYLDNVLNYTQHFFKNSLPRATYSIIRENSVGLGVMGFHSLLQKRNIPFESSEAEALNKEIFSYINQKSREACEKLALSRGACLDAQECGINNVRFSYRTAIAPTATISYIGGCSAGIEPYISNTMLIKNGMGTYDSFNPNLLKILNQNKSFMYNEEFKKNVIREILRNNGSVAKLDFLNEQTKSVYKTAYEINQLTLIKLAADRQSFIDQAQSLNLFFSNKTDLSEIMKMQIKGYQLGVKTFYYNRGEALFRADSAIEKINLNNSTNILKFNNYNVNEITCEGCV